MFGVFRIHWAWLRVTTLPRSVQNFHWRCRALARSLSRYNPGDGGDPRLHPCCTPSLLGLLTIMHDWTVSSLHCRLHKQICCDPGSIRARCVLCQWQSAPPKYACARNSSRVIQGCASVTSTSPGASILAKVIKLHHRTQEHSGIMQMLVVALPAMFTGKQHSKQGPKGVWLSRSR